jgi:piRNA pathway germ-plasm component
MSFEERKAYKLNIGNKYPVKYSFLNESMASTNNPGSKLKTIQENTKMIDEYFQNNICHNLGINHHEIFFFSVEYYCILKDLIYPAEISMSKFSIKDGVHNTMQFMVNPGVLPPDLVAFAELHGQENHRRNLPPYIEGETKKLDILKAILNFMDIKDIGPPQNVYVFVHEETKDSNNVFSAQLTLNQLASGTPFENKFRVVPAEYMLFEINKYRASRRQKLIQSKLKPLASVEAAKEVLFNDKFMYADLGCMFHRKFGWSHKCCLSKVRRVGYMFAQYCMFSNERKFPGFHIPYITFDVKDGELADFSLNLSSKYNSGNF